VAAALLVATLAGGLVAGLGAGGTRTGARPAAPPATTGSVGPAGSVGTAGSLGTTAVVGPAAAVGTVSLTAAAGAVTPYDDPTPSYEVSAAGAVWPLGGARRFAALPASTHVTIVGVTMTADGGGYWLVTSAGGVYNFGDAAWYGSPHHSGISIAAVGLVADPAGGGYWVYGRGGQVTAYGTARYLGGRSGRTIVAMVPTPDAAGYWLADADGAVTAFGSARSYGDAAARRLPAPIVAMRATADGRGYWLVTAAGNVFNEGDARFEGSLALHPANQPITGVASTADGRGYWLVAHDGDLHPFGDATITSPPVLAYVHTVVTAGDRAVEWAMAQLGKPYAWGGTGPASFDCSGLTMQAWRAARVAIPRLADDQFIDLRHVALSDLVDGDLVFWASTAKPTSIYHVAMYLGAGRVVDAPHTGAVVGSTGIGGAQLVGAGSAP
jgi:hypothetical protein